MGFLEMAPNELLAMFYIIGNCVSLLVCLLLYVKNRKNKQTQAQYFGSILLSLAVYFIGDILWAPSFFKLIPNHEIWLKIARMIYYSAAGFLGYFWFLYVEIILESSLVYKKNRRRLLYIPIAFATIEAIVISLFLDPSLKNIYGYLTGFALCIVPFGFVIAAGIHIFIKIREITDRGLKIRYWNLAIWPFVILLVSIVQLFIAELPIYCFGAIIIIISLYIYNQDSLIFTDPLTGVNNRNMLNSFINNNLINLSNNYIVMIDVDKFKSINDTYGHLEGDRALKYMAKILKEATSKKDGFLARYGGDEFIIIFSDITEEEIIKFADEVHELTKKTKDDLGYFFSASIGYAKMEENETIEDVIAKADNNLYNAKEEAHKLGLR